MKYIQIRHWDYWYSVYGVGTFENTQANEVEFSITDDYEGEKLFFHFDFYNMPALKNIIAENEFIKKGQPEYPAFIKKCCELKEGKIECFIGSLYYEEYISSIDEKNMNLGDSKTIFDIKSPSSEPYYAVVFIGDTSSLEPNALLDWMSKLSKIFFKKQIEYQIVEIPTVEETNKAYNNDMRY